MGVCQMPLLQTCFDIYSVLNETPPIIRYVITFSHVIGWLNQQLLIEVTNIVCFLVSDNCELFK